jgi:hypothetical protein
VLSLVKVVVDHACSHDQSELGEVPSLCCHINIQPWRESFLGSGSLNFILYHEMGAAPFSETSVNIGVWCRIPIAYMFRNRYSHIPRAGMITVEE